MLIYGNYTKCSAYFIFRWDDFIGRFLRPSLFAEQTY